MKSKLTLKQIKVESFITSIDSNFTNTVKGGSTPGCLAYAIFSAGTAVATAVFAYKTYKLEKEEEAKVAQDQTVAEGSYNACTQANNGPCQPSNFAQCGASNDPLNC